MLIIIFLSIFFFLRKYQIKTHQMKDYHYLYRPIMFKKNKGVLILNIIISFNIYDATKYFLRRELLFTKINMCNRCLHLFF